MTKEPLSKATLASEIASANWLRSCVVALAECRIKWVRSENGVGDFEDNGPREKKMPRGGGFFVNLVCRYLPAAGHPTASKTPGIDLVGV
jgi:hypothetical protein